MKDRELNVLRELTRTGHEWNRPMDVGGSDGSHHSRTLRTLCRKGFVEKRDRSPAYTPRASYVYRITDEGEARVEH